MSYFLIKGVNCMYIFCRSDLLNKLEKSFIPSFLCCLKRSALCTNIGFVVQKTTPLQQLVPNTGCWSSYGKGFIWVPDLFNLVDPFGCRDFYIDCVELVYKQPMWVVSWLCGILGYLVMLTQVGTQIVYRFRTDKQHKWKCDGCSLKSMQVWGLKWRLLGSCC